MASGRKQKAPFREMLNRKAREARGVRASEPLRACVSCFAMSGFSRFDSFGAEVSVGTQGEAGATIQPEMVFRKQARS